METKNAVIYARFSSHNQTEQSIEGQLKVCYEYAEKNNLKIVHEYVDRALSGTSDKRPQFQQMILDSKFKQFTYVLVYQLDRFSRDRYDSATYKHKLKKNGVRVLSAKENISSDASGILVESVLEGMAEYYSAELGQKIKRGMELTATKCKSIGGKRLFGYNIDEDKHFIINEYEASWVQKIFEWYSVRTPLVEIANRMNAAGLKTVTGRKWDSQSVSRLVGNRKFIGEYHFNEIVIKDGIPRIIDDKLFNQCQRIKSLSSHLSYKADELYILTGKVFCGECGAHMIGHSARGYSKVYYYYKCIDHLKRKTCDMPAIPKDELEQSVVYNVKQILTDKLIEEIVDEGIQKYKGQTSNKELLKSLKKEYDDIQNDIKKFTKLLIQSRNIDVIMDEIDSLKLKALDIKKQIFNEESKTFDIDRVSLINKIKRIRDYDVNDRESMVMFVESFVQSVYVFKDKKIAVILNLDNSVSNTLNRVNSNTLVELKRIELSTS